ncbi:hypothetical protein ACODJC_11960 [Vagococcus fluvialis]|uniref:hypothetical protein n=1 Tax=Vagococcus fluvialis TaxID=2738 RepID=UPI003B5C355B
MKKKYYLFSLSLLSTILVGCSDLGNEGQKVKNSNTIETLESSSVTEETSEIEVEEISKDEKISSMLGSLEQGFSNFFDIKYEEKEKSFLLQVKEDSPMYNQLESLSKNSTGDEATQRIKEISESLIGFSESISKSLGKDYKLILVLNNSYF